MMIDDRMISAGNEAVKGANEWGITAINVFFIVLFVGVVVFFLVYVVKNISKVVDNNTEAIKDSMKNTDRGFSEVKQKQNDIHMDIKEILLNTRHKYGINDYDMKGFSDEKERDFKDPLHCRDLP